MTQPDADGDDRVREFFSGHPLGLDVFLRVKEIVETTGPAWVKVSKSQVSLRRTRAFAYLWLPGTFLSRPHADVVLSIALGRPVESTRWKEVVEPSPGQWMHHLEIRRIEDVDDQVAAWLAEAAARA